MATLLILVLALGHMKLVVQHIKQLHCCIALNYAWMHFHFPFNPFTKYTTFLTIEIQIKLILRFYNERFLYKALPFFMFC